MASAYSPEQVEQYLSFINLPERFHPKNNPERGIEFLSVLHAYQISKIPYENLNLHYSKTGKVSLDPQVLFQKIVLDKRARGGYCMEVTVFFTNILRALGFKCYNCGCKVIRRVDATAKEEVTGW
jgi:arylamine N-acetyltransferase